MEEAKSTFLMEMQTKFNDVMSVVAGSIQDNMNRSNAELENHASTLEQVLSHRQDSHDTLVSSITDCVNICEKTASDFDNIHSESLKVLTRFISLIFFIIGHWKWMSENGFRL